MQLSRRIGTDIRVRFPGIDLQEGVTNVDNDVYEYLLKLKIQAMKVDTEAKYLLYMVKDVENILKEKENDNGRNN